MSQPQDWDNGQLPANEPSYRRQLNSIFQYANVLRGNVMPGELPVSDAGQLGRGNLPTLHGPNSATQYSVVDPRRTPDLPSYDRADAVFTSDKFLGRLRGGSWNPYLWGAQHEEHGDNEAPAAHGANPWGPAGSPTFPGVVEEHGPVTVGQLEEFNKIRQPMPRKSNFWARLFGLQTRRNNTGAFSENTIPQIGQSSWDDEARLTPAAVGVNNTFMIPDIRRTFDQRADAPADTPRDSTGATVYDNAGFPLTATPLEGSPYDVLTNHKYDSDLRQWSYQDYSPDRVRAGVQYDVASTRIAGMPHWFYIRPYDQWAMHHAYGTKGMLKQRLIGRPILASNELPDTLMAFAGRHYAAPAAGMEPLGIVPNTDRQAPQPWDTKLYTPSSSDDAIAQVNNVRQRSWRL
jgi:hypothetical protein